MSVLTVVVAGVDRTEYWHEPTATIWEDPLNGRGTGSISFVVPVEAGVRFEDGQTIVIKEDGTPRFGGILIEPTEMERGDRNKNRVIFFDCQMSDYNILADRRIVSESWSDIEFSLIISGVVTRWMFDENISLAGVTPGADYSVVASNTYARDVFDELGDKSRRGWRIDEAKVLNFKDRDAFPAPFPMNGDTMMADTVTVRPDRQTYRNWQLVEAGTAEFPILVVSGNATEISSRAAIEGTSGRYEHLAQNKDIVNAQQAQDWTGELLNKYDSIGSVAVGKTRLPGYHAGQEVEVDFPNHDINTVNMLIDSVNAEVVHVGNEDEIWYTIRAITGDPFGGYQQHYRKTPPVLGPLRFQNEPGTFRIDPSRGVVIHDPPPGEVEFFKGPASGDMGVQGTAQGISPDGNWLVTMRRGASAGFGGCPGGEFPGCTGSCFGARQLIVEMWAIDSVTRKIASSPSRCGSCDVFNAGTNIKQQMYFSPDGSKCAFFQTETTGVTSVLVVFDISGAPALLGSVVSNVVTNANNGEGVWVGDHIYHVDGSSTDILVYNLTDPSNPVEVDVFSTSVTLIRCLEVSPNGRVLYGVGSDTDGVALDRSDPDNLVEDTVLALGLTVMSWAINDAGTALICFARAGSSDVTWRTVDVVVNTTTITNRDMDNVSLSTTFMDGLGTIWAGDKVMTWNTPDVGVANFLETHIFDASDLEQVVYEETIAWEHTGVSNKGPMKSSGAQYGGYTFLFGGDARIVYPLELIEEPAPLSIDNPLRAGFGGTGIPAYAEGDISYASRVLPDDNRGNGELARLSIGQIGQVLTVSGFANGAFLPRWMDAEGGAVGDLLATSADVLAISGELGDVGDLAVVVVSGTTYYFRAEMFFDADASLGHKVAIGGTAVGNVLMQVRCLDDDTGNYSIIVSGRKTAFEDPAGELGTVRGHALMTGTLECEGNGTIVPQWGTFV